MSATLNQLGYIKRLAIKARCDEPYVRSFDEASDAIASLQQQIELDPDTRKAIFATLRDTSHTKEDLYEAIGVTSLSVSSTASEYDGQRALRWLRGETVEVRRGDQVHQESKPMTARPIRRPAALTREQRIPADAIPGVDADPTTGKTLAFKTSVTSPAPAVMSAEVDVYGQRAIEAAVTALARIGQVVDASTCRAERMGAGLLADTIAYRVFGDGVAGLTVCVWDTPDGKQPADHVKRGDPATIAWTKTQDAYLRAPF
jgi:hypothetical protein